MASFQQIFSESCNVIGMIHVRALPGTPAYQGQDEAILEQALQEARIYQEAGVQGILLENMHDTPYLRSSVGPEITAYMAVVAQKVKEQSGLPCGVQILAGANREALAVAKAAKLDFVRCEGFVFAHVADEGLIQSDAGELLRYRRQIDAEDILIFTDIKKKHSSHALTADVDLAETAKAAEFFRSEGLIVSGNSTGTPVSLHDLDAVRHASKLPLIVGSGVTDQNCAELSQKADALIVGSYFKQKGFWANPLDRQRVRKLMEAVNASKH